jgi:predicted MPP superfamily phosphohydrolase
MRGYTSAGVGSSGIFARFFCPPEIAIHVLRCD